MKFKITGQKIEVKDPLNLVEGTVNSGGIPSYIAEFEFDSVWDGFTKTAIFDADTLDSPIAVLLSANNTCNLPWELFSSEGTLRVSVRGDKGTNVFPTVQTYPFNIQETNATGVPSSEPTPSIYTQILTKVTEAATSAASSANYASNAATSASNAELSASSSASSATSAASSASASATSASNSATSAASAAASAGESATSASNSATSAASAATSAALVSAMSVTASGLEPLSPPTATITTVAGHFNIAFGIPKGDTGAKGDTGDTGPQGTAAGFGNATATVDNNTGIPSVTVTTSGPDTAKVFNFDFRNIKGPKGDSGAGTGDMLVSEYDGTGIVRNSGGIVAYVENITDNKVDKVTGKGLSTNDYDNTEKGNVASNTSARHEHSNKSVIDGIASTDITAWNAKYDKPSTGIPDADIENASTWNTKYDKPSTGIPDSDIASASTWNAKYDKPSTGIPDSDIASASTWNAKQDALPTVVNDRFLHTNSSTGALEWSEVLSGVTSVNGRTGDITITQQDINAPFTVGRLPSGYTEVSYITADGGKHVDTGYYHSSATQYKFKASPYVVASGKYCAVVSARTAYNNADEMTFYFTNASLQYNINADSGNTIKSDCTTGTPVVVEYYMDSSGVHTKTDGVSALNTDITTVTTSTNTAWLFAGNTAGTASDTDGVRIYYFQILEAGILLHNYVPCRRNSDSALGMYDLVTSSFLPVIGDAGNVIAGSDVEPGAGVATLGSDGKVMSSQLPEMSSVVTYTGTVGTTWTQDDDGFFVQSITVTGVRSTDNAIIDIDLSAQTDPDLSLALRNEFGYLVAFDSVENGFTVRAFDETTRSLPIFITIVR